MAIAVQVEPRIKKIYILLFMTEMIDFILI